MKRNSISQVIGQRVTFSLIALLNLGLSFGCYAVSHGKIVYSITSDDNVFRIKDLKSGTTSEIRVDSLDHVTTPRWSPDGEWITFAGGVVHQGRIYAIKPDGTGLHQITAAQSWENLGHPDFSPDGSHISFNQVYGPVYTIEADGDNRQQLNVNLTHSRWSPDGAKIVGTDWGFTYRSDLYVYSLKSGTTVKVTDHEPDEAYRYASWNPGGSQIAYALYEYADAKSSLGKMNADGSSKQLLVGTDYNASLPDWSDDGKEIFFMSDKDGSRAIWSVSLQNSAIEKMLSDPSGVDYFDVFGKSKNMPESSFTALTLGASTLLLVFLRSRFGVVA